MKTLRDRLAPFLDYWKSIPTGSKVVALGVLLVSAALVAGLAYYSQKEPEETLMSDLNAEDMRAITRKLAELSIPFSLGADQKSVTVPVSQTSYARMELAKAGLPGQQEVGLEKFDGSTLGMSSYVQHIQYVRAMQGELVRSIEKLGAVQSARVHISIPPKSTFLEEQELPKGSVVLELKKGQSLSKSEISGIAHLVAGAVEGLKVSQVTIVDSHGQFLHRPEEEGQNAIPTQLLETERTIESDYERRITDLLTPVVGLGKVRAKVTVELDLSHLNRTEETFDPDKSAVKTSLKTEEVSHGSRPNPLGIPGSRSNLPGTELNNATIPTAVANTEKTAQNQSYAVPRKVETVEIPSGAIKRLTAAVIVDGHYTKPTGNNSAETFTPRSEEELRHLQEIVENAIGFDGQRRDSMTMTSLPFMENEFGADHETSSGLMSLQHTPHWLMPLLRQLGGVLAAVFFFLLVIRPLLRQLMEYQPKVAQTMMPKTVEQLETARRNPEILSLAAAATQLNLAESIEKSEQANLKKMILEKMNKEPKKALRIIKDWVDEPQGTGFEPVPLELKS